MIKKVIKFLFLILMLYNLNTFGQLPDFDDNISFVKYYDPQVELRFSGEFQYLLSYHIHSYWSEEFSYYVLGFDGRDWKPLLWTIKKDSDRQTVKNLEVDENRLDDFFALLLERNFYDFRQASLNLNEKDDGDGVAKVIEVYDGLYEEFQLVSPNSHRVYSVYAADLLQKHFPTDDRANFIICRNEFLAIFNERD